MLDAYLKGIAKTAKQADATEPSYYPALKDLLEAFAEESGHSKAQVTAQPKKTEAGNPDFRVWDGKQHVIGYIEAKPDAAIIRIMGNPRVCRLIPFDKSLTAPWRDKKIIATYRFSATVLC